MSPHFSPHHPTTASAVYTRRPVQLVAEPAPQPLGARVGQTVVPVKVRTICNRSAHGKTAISPNAEPGGRGSQLAARPTSTLTVRKSGVSGQLINFPAWPDREGRAVANQPLLTTRTLEAVQRLQDLFARQSADRVIDMAEQRAIRRELAIVEGEARHADNCSRYAMALLRDTGTVAYLETLRLRAGVEPLDAA